jgi:hypothetical protein
VSSFIAYSAKHETAPAVVPEETPNRLEYPNHPLSAHLGEVIARLPQGFSDIALKRDLSTQIIDLILDLQEQSQEVSSHPSRSNKSIPPAERHIYTADKCLSFLQSRSMLELERMVCGGLLAYVISCQDEDRTRVYDEALKKFLAELANYTFFNYDQEVLLWVTFCFAGLQGRLFNKGPDDSAQDITMDTVENDQLQEPTQEDGQFAVHFFHHTIMRFKESNKWRRVEAVLKKYLWSPERMADWKERWEECVAVHRPQGQSRSTTPSTVAGSGSGNTNDGRASGFSASKRSSQSPD